MDFVVLKKKVPNGIILTVTAVEVLGQSLRVSEGNKVATDSGSSEGSFRRTSAMVEESRHSELVVELRISALASPYGALAPLSFTTAVLYGFQSDFQLFTNRLGKHIDFFLSHRATGDRNERCEGGSR